MAQVVEDLVTLYTTSTINQWMTDSWVVLGFRCEYTVEREKPACTSRPLTPQTLHGMCVFPHIYLHIHPCNKIKITHAFSTYNTFHLHWIRRQCKLRHLCIWKDHYWVLWNDYVVMNSSTDYIEKPKEGNEPTSRLVTGKLRNEHTQKKMERIPEC